MLAVAACMAGCGAAPATVAGGEPDFPARDSAWLKEGTFVNVDDLRQMAPGLTKAQVYALLQAPHFGEAGIGARTWNYLFDFRTGDGDAFVTCQYQVQYDGNGRVQATYWKPTDCARFGRRADPT